MQAAPSIATTAFRSRTWLLHAIGFDLLLIAGRVLLYPSLWSQVGAATYVLEPVVLLVGYAVIVVWLTADTDTHRRWPLVYGSAVGPIAGGIWIVNLALETFANLSPLGLLATAPFLLGGFLLWGVAGFCAARRTGSVSSGVLAAVWSAMICVLMTIAFGLLLTYTSLPRLEHNLVADPDFLRSHWSDLRAFAIANSLDSAFSHLLGGLLVGTIVGAAGGFLGLLVRRRASPAGSER